MEKLTPSELGVTRLTTEGYNVTQVAIHLGISPKTVEHHKSNIYEKLDIHNNAQLCQWYWGETSNQHLIQLIEMTAMNLTLIEQHRRPLTRGQTLADRVVQIVEAAAIRHVKVIERKKKSQSLSK
jgi:DNA-binding CsgD family transcriptional regulator